VPAPRESKAEIAVLSKVIDLLDQTDRLLELMRASIGEVVQERTTVRPKQPTAGYRIVARHLWRARGQLRCARRRLAAKQRAALDRRAFGRAH
jgi:hypothetical protein